MNRRPISPVARPLPMFALPVAVAVCALLLWAGALTRSNSLPWGEPRLDAANPGQTAPRLVSSVTEIDFGTVQIGDSGTSRLVLTNTSLDDVAITVSSTWLSEPDALAFSSDFDGPRMVPAGDSLVIELRFTPVEAGHRVGALYVSHDGKSNLDIFTLSGNGAISDASIPALGGAMPAIDPAFGKSDLSGITDLKPTSLQFGPDGRLYVADMLGLLKAFEIEREGANDYRVVSEETITLIQDIPNHDDDGEPNSAITKRLVTGLLVTGTASSPVIFVGSSDPRIGGGPSHTETGLDTNSGVISRLTRTANGNWEKLDLVRGLPRSEENHHTNGMALNEATQRLYVTAGGNTNEGGPSNNFAMLPEYALSAAILEIDLGMIGESTYDLPTLDDETRPGTQDKGDPFGGNDGRNQAKLVPGGPVQVYAPGFRNAYDIVLTGDGRMYSIDNGPNSGWGGPPIGEGANGNCTNQQSEPGVTFLDSLHLISGRGYYGGHPNPTRANLANTFNTSKPQSPVSVANPVECDLRGAGGTQALTTFGFSTNGLGEYRASNFGGAMQGDLLAAAWNNTIQRLVLDDSGSELADKDVLFANVGGLPLDVTAQGDSQHFPGTIWVADFVHKNIVVFEPVDYDGAVTQVCGGTPSADDDNDGFSNADELANGTDPCSPADLPADLDGDFLSDRIDPDDDGDGLSDLNDPFPRDPDNGRATKLPVTHEWENDSESAGFLFNLGFSGLMNNGTSEYLDLFSLANLTTGGAAGVLTIDDIPDGDPITSVNSQAYGFQFGIDVTSTTAPFTVHTRLLSPFAGADIGGHQSMGFYIGTGDQDNYIKLVTNSTGSTGGVQFAAERTGTFEQVANVAAPVFGQAEIDLYLSVDPGAGTVRAFYRSGNDDEIVEVGSATALPIAWLEADSGLAVGIISTSFGGPTFGATWDFIRVTGGAPGTTTDEGVNNKSGNFAGEVHTAHDGLIAIEAEHAVDNVPAADRNWVPGSRSGARGNASMITSPDTGLIRFSNGDAPHLSYQVDFPQAGSWHVWVRGWGDAVGGEGKSDSVHVGIDGTLAGAAAMQGFPAGGWAWSNSTRGNGPATVQVDSPGQHTIDVWMREDGFEFDALVLSQDSGYLPTGSGPAEHHVSAGDEGGSAGNSDAGSDSGTDTGSDGGTDTGGTDGTDTGGADGSNTGGVGGTDSGSDGGTDTGSDGSTVGETGTWTTVAQTLDDRTEAIRVQRDDSMWLFNGFDGNIKIRASVERYDLADNTWASIGSTLNSPDGAAALTHSGAVMVDDELWLVGGRLGNHPGRVIDQILIYNFTTGLWRYGPTLPEPFAAGGAAIAGGRLHVFGGIDAQANCDVDQHWSLDPASPGSGWQNHGASSPMPLARNHFSTVVMDELIYAIGGQHSHDKCLARPGQTQTPYVHVYDPVQDNWTRLADLPTPQSHAEPSTFVHGGRIWMVGGLVDGDRVVIYDPATDEWEVRADLELPQKLLAPSAAIADGRLFVVGGGAPNVYNPTRATRVIVLPASDTPNDTDIDAGADDNNGSGETGNFAGEVHTAHDGLIAIEAEHAVDNVPAADRNWVPGSRSGARGNASMITSPDTGLIRFSSGDAPRLSYQVDFPQAGSWHVWVRGWGDAVGGEGKSDSVHVGIDGTLAGAAAMQGFPTGGWAWSNSTRGNGLATVQVDSPGQHTIDVWMREDGFEFDALVLSQDSGYVPTGSGPAEHHVSAGDEGGSAGSSDAGSDGGTGSGGDEGSGSGEGSGGSGNDSPYNATNDVVVVEAEAFASKSATASHAWVSGTHGGSSGGSMVTTPDSGTLKAGAIGSPVMRYEVDFPTAGSWRVWVRGWGDAINGEGKSDSVHVGLNGSLAGAAAMQGFPAGGWTWSNSTRSNGFATVQVNSSGRHTIDVWMREDGLEIDALVLTTNPDFVPSGAYGSGAGDAESSEGSDNPVGESGDGNAEPSRAPDTLDWVERSSTDGSSATKRHEAGAVEFNGKLFLLGGRGNRPVDIYDPVTERWSKGAAAPFEMHHFQPVVFDGRIWVVGAMTCCYPREGNVSHVWSYSPASNVWEQGVEIPEARRRGSAATVVRDGKIYLAGGNTLGHDGGAVSWFDEFDPSTGAWRTLPDAPVARDHAQGGLIDDRLVLAAGRRTAQPNVFANTIARVDVFDFATSTWSRGMDIPTTRAGTMAVTVGREVLVIGGESAGRTAAHDEVEAYDVDTNYWRALRPLQLGRHSGGAARLDDGVHVVAGASSTGGANETASHESLAID
ncbi:MAG: hypothetical protein HKN42_01170 [Granulosicoccus sp.]|nr:hypothetical protein [Granulosicoccus sp.]